MNKKQVLTMVFTIAFTIIFAGIIVSVLGYKPQEAYTELIKGALVGKLNFGTTLQKYGPILLTALAFAVTYKAKFFNLGGEGAFYIGALAAAGVGQIQGLPVLIHIPLTLLSGIVFGGIWTAIPGILRALKNVNEMVTTIMLNYVAILLSDYFLLNVWKEVEIASGRSKTIQESAQFAFILKPSRLSSGIFLVILIFFIVYWLVNKTSFGFKLKTTGLNAWFANYVGYDVKKTLIITTIISGAIAGIAGSIETMGVYKSMYLQFSSGIAFDGMLAALIAGGRLKYIPITAFMVAAFQAGALGMERFTGIPKSLIDMFVPTLIILLSMKDLYDVSKIRDSIKKRFDKNRDLKKMSTRTGD